MSLINIAHLTFSYEGSYDTIFENVSFQIDTDWKLGFTGRNGRGKTTFLNLLRGKYEYSGSITATVDFEYFPFQVREQGRNPLEIIAGLGIPFQQWEVERELSLLEVDAEVLNRPFATLSKGEQTKVMLAALFLKENQFLLIDEPTNHLDLLARKTVASYLKAKKGFILVSHDRMFLDSCIDHILAINRHNIEIQKGNFSSWWENKQRQDQYERAENEKLQNEMRRLAEASRRTAAWSDKVEKTKIGVKNMDTKPDRGYIGHKAAKMMKRAQVIAARRETAATEKAKLLKNIESTDSLAISPLVHPAARLVSLQDVAVYYEARKICDRVRLVIERGDRIALRGKNGSGKSSLIKLICGEPLTFTGDLNLASNLKISYVSQDTSFLQGSLSEFAATHRIEESLFKTILRKLDFSRIQFEKEMTEFSEGQKKKVLIARSLCERAHLYVWDEPLNFIDVISRMQIEQLLLQHQPTILFVEHDRAFCDAIATKSVDLI